MLVVSANMIWATSYFDGRRPQTQKRNSDVIIWIVLNFECSGLKHKFGPRNRYLMAVCGVRYVALCDVVNT
jgi:hypothetical protein